MLIVDIEPSLTVKTLAKGITIIEALDSEYSMKKELETQKIVPVHSTKNGQDGQVTYHSAGLSQSRSCSSSRPKTKTEKTTTSTVLPTPPPSNVPATWYESAFWHYFFKVYTRLKLYARPLSNDFAAGPESERGRKKLATYAVVYNWLCLPHAVRDVYRRQRDNMPRNWRDSDPNPGVFKMAELRKFVEIVLDKSTKFPGFGILDDSDFSGETREAGRELDKLMKMIVLQAKSLELTHSTELFSAPSDPFRASQVQDTSLAAIFGFIHGPIHAADPKSAKDPIAPEILHVQLGLEGSAPSSSTSSDDIGLQKFTSDSKCLEWHAENPLYSLPSARAEDSLRMQLGRTSLKAHQHRSPVPIGPRPLLQKNRLQLNLNNMSSSSSQNDHNPVRSTPGSSEGDAMNSGPPDTLPPGTQQYVSFRSPREEDRNMASAVANMPPSGLALPSLDDILRPTEKALPSLTSRLSPERSLLSLAQSEHITLSPIRNGLRQTKENSLPSIQHVLWLLMQQESNSPDVCVSRSDNRIQDGRGNYWGLTSEHLMSTQIVQNSQCIPGSSKSSHTPTLGLSSLNDLADFTSEPKQSYYAEFRRLLPIPSLPNIRPRLPPPPAPDPIPGVVVPSLSTVTRGYHLTRSSESSTKETAGSQSSRSGFQPNSGPVFSSLHLDLLDSNSDSDSRDIIFERHRSNITQPQKSVQGRTSLALNPCASKGSCKSPNYDRAPYGTERENELGAEPSRKRQKRISDLSYVRDIEQTTVNSSRTEPDMHQDVASRRFRNIDDGQHLLPVAYSDSNEASHKNI